MSDIAAVGPVFYVSSLIPRIEPIPHPVPSGCATGNAAVAGSKSDTHRQKLS